jgi:hypothetical protein
VANALPGTALTARRTAADRRETALKDRRRGFGEEARTADDFRPSPGQPPPQPFVLGAGGNEQGPTRAALREAVRAVPPMVEARLSGSGHTIELSFGRSLSVEVRRGRDGLEVVLRPEAALSRAAAAELPGLVEALRARGLAVSRAQVRPGAAEGVRRGGAR